MAEKSYSEWEKLINEWVFNEKDRYILKRKLLDGICFEPLAEEINLSVQQTKKRFYKAKKNFTKRIQK